MKRFICENVFVPLRIAPAHRSEMLSQVLFGETYCILDKIDNWTKIITDFDGSSGWIDMDHLQQSGHDTPEKSFILNRSLLCYKNDNTKMILEAGCEIFDPDYKSHRFRIADHIYTTANDFKESYVTINESLSDTAMRFINCPYIWGGRIAPGLDCSGFTQLVFKIHGITLPRNSWQQAENGEEITFITEARAGDLAFFGHAGGKITHTGIILSQGLIIHASGRVRIDPVDHLGIYKQEISNYSHKLIKIKRIKIQKEG